MVFTIVCGFILIALMDLLPLIRRKKWHAVAAFSCAFAAALTLAVLSTLHVEVPSAMDALGKAVRWLGLAYPP